MASRHAQRADRLTGLAFQVPTNFPLAVKPVDDTKASQYKNSDHAGTPENLKTFVTGGARGGGGSNFTGSLSAISGVSCPLLAGVIARHPSAIAAARRCAVSRRSLQVPSVHRGHGVDPLP